MVQQSKIKTLVGAVLALTMVAICTLLGAMTTFIIGWTVGWALFDAGISPPAWLGVAGIVLYYAGAPIGFVIGLLWARGVLRRD